MVIMLFIFVILIFPINLRVKLNFNLNDRFLWLKFFLFHIFITDVKFIQVDNNIYLKIGSKKPTKFSIDLSNKSAPIPFNPIYLKNASINITQGTNPIYTTILNYIINIAKNILYRITNKYKIQICTTPIFHKSVLSIKAKLSAYTNILALLYALIIYSISKIFTKKEKKNVIQQSN